MHGHCTNDIGREGILDGDQRVKCIPRECLLTGGGGCFDWGKVKIRVPT